MKTPLKAHLMLIAAAIIGGLNYTVSKLIMPNFAKPLSIVIVRGIIAVFAFHLLHYFFVKEKIQLLPMNQLAYAIENGFIDGNTLYFNNLVQTKKDLAEEWIVPLKDSWLGKKLNLQEVA